MNKNTVKERAQEVHPGLTHHVREEEVYGQKDQLYVSREAQILLQVHLADFE